MSVRSLLLVAALAVVVLWPQGLVLCVSPGAHTEIEHPAPASCPEGPEDCEDIDSPLSPSARRPDAPPTPAPAPYGDLRPSFGRPESAGPDLPAPTAPRLPPVSLVLTI